MILIPAGEFLMGNTDKAVSSDEKPQRPVYLDAYQIYKTEVTVAQYKQFCDTTKRNMPTTPVSNPRWAKTNHPIVNVSYDDARAYCQWAGGDLPTEAQWEKAARGTNGRIYPWGDEWDTNRCANSVDKNNLDGTVAVGRYPQGASPYGVLDMAGNVWEWCLDVYDEAFYKTAVSRNPLNNPTTNDSLRPTRVCRGGFWDLHIEGGFRASNRGRNSAGNRGLNLGFRGALSPRT